MATKGKITTVAAPRTLENLYNGKYVDPNLVAGLNTTYKKRDQSVGFVFNSAGGGSLTFKILSLGAAPASLCLADCTNSSCCEGKQDYSFSMSAVRTPGVVEGSWDVTIDYSPEVYVNGFDSVAFFFAAFDNIAYAVAACCPLTPSPGKIVYTLKGYEAGVLSDKPFVGSIANVSAFVKDAYIAG